MVQKRQLLLHPAVSIVCKDDTFAKTQTDNQINQLLIFYTMRFNLKKTLAFVAAGLMLPLFALAQSVRISGTVTDWQPA